MARIRRQRLSPRRWKCEIVLCALTSCSFSRVRQLRLSAKWFLIVELKVQTSDKNATHGEHETTFKAQARAMSRELTSLKVRVARHLVNTMDQSVYGCGDAGCRYRY